MTAAPAVGQAVVITGGRHANEPGVIVSLTARTADILLGRTGERVTVRLSSLALF